MTLHDKYPTLEQSKRIAELLGDKAPASEMNWQQTMYERKGDITNGVWLLERDKYKYAMVSHSRYPAYDLAEMGEILESLDSCWNESVMKSDDGWYIEISYDHYGIPIEFVEVPTEAQARAALLIHLLEGRNER